jgi:hypothetical protein
MFKQVLTLHQFSPFGCDVAHEHDLGRSPQRALGLEACQFVLLLFHGVRTGTRMTLDQIRSEIEQVAPPDPAASRDSWRLASASAGEEVAAALPIKKWTRRAARPGHQEEGVDQPLERSDVPVNLRDVPRKK